MLWDHRGYPGSDTGPCLWLPCEPCSHCRLDHWPEGEHRLLLLHDVDKHVQVGVCKGLLFLVCQCAGAVVGAGILYGVVPDTVRGFADLGCTRVSPSISVGQVRNYTRGGKNIFISANRNIKPIIFCQFSTIFTSI